MRPAGFLQVPDCRGSRISLTHFLKVKKYLFLLPCWCFCFTALPPCPQRACSLIFAAAATSGNDEAGPFSDVGSTSLTGENLQGSGGERRPAPVNLRDTRPRLFGWQPVYAPKTSPPGTVYGGVAARAPSPPPLEDREEYDSEEVGASNEFPALVEPPVGDASAVGESMTPDARDPFADVATRQYTGREVAVDQSPIPMSETSPVAGPAERYEAQEEEEEPFSGMMPDVPIDAEQSPQASNPWGGEEGGEEHGDAGEPAVEEGSANWLQSQKEDEDEAESRTSPRMSTAVAQEATQEGEPGVEGRSHTGTQRPSQRVLPSSRTVTAWEEGARTGAQSGSRRSSRSQTKSTSRRTSRTKSISKGARQTRQSRKRLAKRLVPLAGLAALLLGGATYAGHRAWKKRRSEAGRRAPKTTGQATEIPAAGVAASPVLPQAVPVPQDRGAGRLPAAVPAAQARQLGPLSATIPAPQEQGPVPAPAAVLASPKREPGPVGGSAPKSLGEASPGTLQKFW